MNREEELSDTEAARYNRQVEELVEKVAKFEERFAELGRRLRQLEARSVPYGGLISGPRRLGK